MYERRFRLPENRGILVFSVDVLKHMYKYAQTSFWSREAGGQLFTMNPEQSLIQISLATGPYRQDWRTRWSFHPDVNKATDDRYQHFANGLHAVGLWHTHPEVYPTPSDSDKTTTWQYLEAFQGEMDGFLLVIVGNQESPPNLAVWLAWAKSEKSWIQLSEI